MKNVKKKSVISRMFSLMAVVLSLGMMLMFTAVSASAADVPADEIVTMEVQDDENVLTEIFAWNPSIVAHATGGANQQQAPAQSNTALSTDADDSFNKMIDFITTWFTRIGLAVGLVGGIMFAFGMKDDNADTKQRGLMTLVAGLAVAAICAAAHTIFPSL